MATFDPSLPLGAKIKPPEGCTCGKNVMCPLHFCADDYRPGAQVTFNPYTFYESGMHLKKYLGNEIFVVEKTEYGKYPDTNNVLYVTLRGHGYWHVGWLRPWGFLTYVKRALEVADETR